MIAMVPASAPCGPPETGASINSSPRSASSAAMARVAFGSPVVWSTMMPPGAMPAASPPSPKIASRTSFEVGRQSSTASQAWPNASRLWAGCAPAAAMSCTASGRRSNALSLRLTSSRRASAPPILPRPTYPSSMKRTPSLPRHPLRARIMQDSIQLNDCRSLDGHWCYIRFVLSRRISGTFRRDFDWTERPEGGVRLRRGRLKYGG